jgi:hypothetical protein
MADPDSSSGADQQYAVSADPITAIDTVVGFADPGGGGRPDEAAASGQTILASAELQDGNLVLTYPDQSTLTLIGITQIDSGIFA